MVHFRRGNLRLLTSRVAVALLAAGLLIYPANAAPPVAAPAKVEGKFNVKIGGFYQGEGNAAVAGSTLTVSAQVTDEAGHAGAFSVAGVTVDATNHFSGSGTLAGKTISITGRLDPVDVAETQLKTCRIAANFTVSDGHRGRIAGFVPIDPGTPDPTNPTPPTSPTLPVPSGPTAPVPTDPSSPGKPSPTKPAPTTPVIPTEPASPGDNSGDSGGDRGKDK